MRHLNMEHNGSELAHPTDLTDPEHLDRTKRQRSACPKCGSAIVRTSHFSPAQDLHESTDGHGYLYVAYEGEWMCQRRLEELR